MVASTSPTTAKKIEAAFRKAKDTAIFLGHPADTLPHSSGGDFNEHDLLREGAWVIMCSGFRERIVRKLFSKLSICFCNWESAESIVLNKELCRLTALDVFRNLRKIDAIIALAERIDEIGFDTLRKKIYLDPISELKQFFYIGPITSFHIAKNIGFNVSKPDRHLLRISEKTGYHDVNELCSFIAEITSEPISVVDGILWRLAESGDQGDILIAELIDLIEPHSHTSPSY